MPAREKRDIRLVGIPSWCLLKRIGCFLAAIGEIHGGDRASDMPN